MGGEIVPAMVCIFERVVNVGSIRDDVWWTGSWRVAVVIVVYMLFSIRKLVKGCRGRSLKRLILMSPWMVISVWGY